MNTSLPTTEKLLLGPGPSNASKAIYDAIGRPLLGHLDPDFLDIMEDCKGMLRTVFQTQNNISFPVSGTGSSGMEFLFVNFLEKGDRIVVGVNGVFGTRMANLAEKMGVETIRVEFDWGKPVDNSVFIQKIERHRPKLVCIVSGETSTGVYQDMTDLGRIAHENGSLLLVDCVTSLAGMPVLIDAWEADLAFSGTQKCISCPPGLAPVTVSERALEVFRNRRTPVPSFYFSLMDILSYIDGKGGRAYHHTAPINMVYALHAALVEIVDEGLNNRWARHADAAQYLIEQTGKMGLTPLVEEGDRLNPLTTLRVPSGVDDAQVRSALLKDFDIEIGAGLGPFAGSVWRIGLMGVNANRGCVDRLVQALKEII